jgi:hypothetical protein
MQLTLIGIHFIFVLSKSEQRCKHQDSVHLGYDAVTQQADTDIYRQHSALVFKDRNV